MELTNYLIIPYKFRGTGIGEGADCFTLAKLFYETELNILLPSLDYSEDWFNTSNHILDGYSGAGFSITTEVVRGDILLFIDRGIPKHIGIALDEEYFLHATESGTAVHSYKSGRWSSRIYCKLRHKDNPNDNFIRQRLSKIY